MWLFHNPGHLNAIRSTTLLDSMRHRLVQVQIVSIPKVDCFMLGMHLYIKCKALKCARPVHPQHNYGDICPSAVSQLNFARNSTFMNRIYLMNASFFLMPTGLDHMIERVRNSIHCTINKTFVLIYLLVHYHHLFSSLSPSSMLGVFL
jgi:hypothetical protein